MKSKATDMNSDERVNSSKGEILEELVETIQSREDFVRFTLSLIKDLKSNPEQWENINLEDYLEAIAAWATDMDSSYINRGESVPKITDWKVFAEILWAASAYE